MPKDLTTHEKTVEAPALLELRADLLVALCTQPLPPGSRITLRFLFPGEADPMVVAGKVVSIEPAPNQHFKIAVRTNSVTKAARALLEKLI